MHATQGQGQVLGIAGEPGIGKSRLLDEFRHSLGERPVTYGEGHCLAYSSGTPYLPIRDLLRLTAGDSLRLVQSVPQAEEIPDRLQQAIIGTAAGNPFFLEELARALGAHGHPPAPRSIPDTIQAVLAARIDRLPSPAKRLLQAAGVIGSEVSVPSCRPSPWPTRSACAPCRPIATWASAPYIRRCTGRRRRAPNC
jgi:predicted ATPase